MDFSHQKKKKKRFNGCELYYTWQEALGEQINNESDILGCFLSDDYFGYTYNDLTIIVLH